jgi:hypothetical protein
MRRDWVRCPVGGSVAFRREEFEQEHLLGASCQTCVYCDEDSERRVKNVCRVNPPELMDLGCGPVRVWPPVDVENDWCGRYRESIPMIDLEMHRALSDDPELLDTALFRISKSDEQPSRPRTSQPAGYARARADAGGQVCIVCEHVGRSDLLSNRCANCGYEILP